MIHLLDVNVLIALGDSNHPHRAAALQFFEKCATLEGWATCPLTENAFIRIFGSPNYPHGPGQHLGQGGGLTHFELLPGTNFGLTIFLSRLPTRFQTFLRQRNSPTSTFSHLP